MAIWEAMFAIIPTGDFPADYLERLDTVAPRLRSSHREMLAWGAEDGSRIEVWHERGSPVDGSLRVDMRDPDPGFVLGAMEFLRYARFGLEDEAGEWVDPEPAEFSVALRRSRAVRFLADPELYLRRVELGGWQDA